MPVLQQSVKLTENTNLNTNLNKSAVRFAAICHDLEKPLTPKEMWPSHHGHEKRGLNQLAHYANALECLIIFKN